MGQASAAITELQRLKKIPGVQWTSMAVLGRTHQDLAQVRALAETEGIPFRWWADRDQIPPLHRIREIHLGYAGFYPASAPIHSSLASLKTGNPVKLLGDADRILVCNHAGARVAALSKTAREAWAGK